VQYTGILDDIFEVRRCEEGIRTQFAMVTSCAS